MSVRETPKFKREARLRRHKRVRRQVRGSAERPRLTIFRSNRHIFAQIIDDDRAVTLAAADSLKIEGAKGDAGTKVNTAKAVGEQLGKAAVEKGITQVAFDRGGYLYHGRVAALAEGAREAGLKF